MFTAISAVSLNDLQPSTAPGTQSNTPGVNAPKQLPAPVSQPDTVKLSVTQQVRNLHSEGEGPGQIASSLGLTSTQVNGDLYVSLTWPQLLSKVASSSLNLGSTPSDASASASAAPAAAAPVSGAAAPAASIFPAPATASSSAAAGTKDAALPAGVIFPAPKDAVDPAAPGTRNAFAPAAAAVSPGRDAKAA